MKNHVKYKPATLRGTSEMTVADPNGAKLSVICGVLFDGA